MKTVAIMIDGGHVRVAAKKAGRTLDPELVETLAVDCCTATEEIRRILFYDCAPFAGDVALPVSGATKQFRSFDRFLRDLAKKDLFAVRQGVLKFRGWVPRTIPIAGKELTDADFKPDFEQKGVDMRIGLDMANYSANRSVELIALCTNDTDCIPAMKHARRAGLQVALVCVTGASPAPELLAHCDFTRHVTWP